VDVNFSADKGPYTVRMADRSVVISDTSEVGFKDYQVGDGKDTEDAVIREELTTHEDTFTKRK
jgi:hypothetical protein